MTKYVLNSGGLKTRKDGGKAFFEATLEDLGATPRLLMCFFAEKREDWEDQFDKYSKVIGENISTDQKIDFELAFPDSFEEQVDRCDAIYIHGGDDHLLQYWLRQFDIPKIWEGKTVATNSASSSALAVASWTCDWRQCMNGLGILPIKFIPHFDSDFGSDDSRGPIDWKGAKKELTEYGDKNQPIYALKEGDFVVFRK